MIGQQIGVEFLVPVALERLVENAFEQGDFHPGDLLGAVLRLPREYWHTHFAEWQGRSGLRSPQFLPLTR